VCTVFRNKQSSSMPSMTRHSCHAPACAATEMETIALLRCTEAVGFTGVCSTHDLTVTRLSYRLQAAVCSNDSARATHEPGSQQLRSLNITALCCVCQEVPDHTLSQRVQTLPTTTRELLCSRGAVLSPRPAEPACQDTRQMA
jgi:hypothetical protein